MQIPADCIRWDTGNPGKTKRGRGRGRRASSSHGVAAGRGRGRGSARHQSENEHIPLQNSILSDDVRIYQTDKLAKEVQSTSSD